MLSTAINFVSFIQSFHLYAASIIKSRSIVPRILIESLILIICVSVQTKGSEQRQGSLKASKSEANLRCHSITEPQELQILGKNKTTDFNSAMDPSNKVPRSHKSAEPANNLQNVNQITASGQARSTPSHSRNPSRDIGSFVATSPSVPDWTSKTGFAGQPRARVTSPNLLWYRTASE